MPLSRRGRFFIRRLRWTLLDSLHDDPPVPWARAINDVYSRLTPLRAWHHRIALPGRDAERPRLRLAWVSDLHAGPTTADRVLAQAADAVVAFAPDVLVLGGDYVYRHHRHVERLRPLLRRARGRLATLALFGNHDVVAGREPIHDVLVAEGARVLCNQACRLPAPHDDIFVAGLDDLTKGAPDAARALRDVPDDAPLLFLTHNPDGVAELGERRADLILAGHTHGGHICFPGGHPVLVPTELGYIAGRYNTPNGPLIVSRGVGCIDVPVRAFAPADVLLCELGGR